MSEKSKPKKSSVRHMRAIQRDRSKRPNTAPPDAQIQARLTELIHWLIRQAQALTDLPVAMITNGALLYLPEVREELP